MTRCSLGVAGLDGTEPGRTKSIASPRPQELYMYRTRVLHHPWGRSSAHQGSRQSRISSKVTGLAKYVSKCRSFVHLIAVDFPSSIYLPSLQVTPSLQRPQPYWLLKLKVGEAPSKSRKKSKFLLFPEKSEMSPILYPSLLELPPSCRNMLTAHAV